MSKGKRSTGGRKVTPQRKQNNRKAQQRYREKRKQQAAEREQQVAVLSSQLAAMQSIQNEHAAVSTENVHLREVLLQKEAEIERLKVCTISRVPNSMKCSSESHWVKQMHFLPRNVNSPTNAKFSKSTLQ